MATKRGLPCFEIFKGKDENFYFHLKSKNGKIILQSEGYVSKTGAKNGIAAIHRVFNHRLMTDKVLIPTYEI